MAKETQSKKVAVIGTGNFGQAVGKRLANSRYDVTFGSRRPSSRVFINIDFGRSHPKVLSIRDAINRTDVIILAIRVGNYQEFASQYRNDIGDKIIIDVSNPSKSTAVAESNAQWLQELLPKAKVVKAFNVISAYTMDSEYDGSSRVVPVASDDDAAKDVAMDIGRAIGFRPYDSGSLSAARYLEIKVTRLFPEWRFPIILSTIVFTLCWVYVVCILWVYWGVRYSWEQLFLKVLNKPTCMTCMILFALTYLPSGIAGCLQLYRGTKNSRFPQWLDLWMRSRKQLGLIAFFFACLHAWISTLVMSSSYYGGWFHKQEVVIPVNMTEEITMKLPMKSYMKGRAELINLSGILSFLVFSILAVTSFPSVGETLNWVEWRFVQSRLGIFGLALGVLHVYLMGMAYWIRKNSIITLMVSATFVSTLPAALVLFLKIVLSLPGIRGHLRRIRHGWERNGSKMDEESMTGLSDGDVNTHLMKQM